MRSPASRAIAAATGDTESGPEPAFSLVGLNGDTRLELATWSLGTVARLEDLVVEFPGVAQAPDLPARLRNRRGRLLQATVVTDLDRLAGELERPGVRARLAAAGISDVRIGLGDGAFRLVGRASMGDRDAAFTARAQLGPAAARRPELASGGEFPSSPAGERAPAGRGQPTSPRIRLTIDDLRIYGFLPVPAPILARSILSSLVQARPGTRWWIDFDPLESALLETFAAHGWRLPDASRAHLGTIELTSRRIALAWSQTAAARGPSESDGAADAPTVTLVPEMDEADGLLARGDRLGALDAYRRALRRSPDGGAATRVLEILIASPTHVAEADALAGEMLTRQAEEPLPLLVRAVAAAERGDAAVAADTYEQIATIARRRNEDEDVIIARLAAAELWLRADKTERARRLADQVLATMPAHANGETARVLEILSNRLVARGELVEADQVFESRLALATDAATRAALIVKRARARLLTRDGVAGALVVLAALPLDQAPRQGLELRAELGERLVSPDDAVPALDELTERARRDGDEDGARAFEARVVALQERARIAHPDPARPPAPAPPGGSDSPRDRDAHAAPVGGGASATPAVVPTHSVDELERQLLDNPSDAAAAERLAEVYGRIPEPHERVEALFSLLRRAPGLSSDRRKAVYASLGQSAEASGDLDRAEQAYRRAATIEAEPAQRASFLVSHARVLLARGETENAIADLEEALRRVPEHAGALALRGDLAFRLKDWARARAIYASLAAARGADEVISRELLLYRRAQIAQAGGQAGEGEAETHLREVAILNPRHVEAREALADIALRRRDFGGAALRLEEVLRLLPLDALDRLLDIRQRLGGIYLQLQDWTSARYYLELVLAQDPTRSMPLAILIDIYLRLASYREAAEACGRLARLHAEPRQRAEILYRQGEILRAFLADDAGALDAYLRASDLDPQYAPPLARLAEYDWRAGAFEDLSEMAGELRAAGFVPDDDTRDLPLRLAIATRLAPRAGEPPTAVPPADQPVGHVVRRARLLAEAAGFLAVRAPRDLDPVLDALANEGLATGEGAPGPASGFYRALEDLVQEDPACANMGALRALGRAAERGGWTAAARGLYSVLVFIDPGDAAATALDALGPARTLDPEQIEMEGMLALLVQRQPLEALGAIARQDPFAAEPDREQEGEQEQEQEGHGVGPVRRRELLRTLPARELIGAMLSLDYQRAVA